MRMFNPDAPYQSVKNAARLSGLSTYYIRKGIQEGRIPFIRIGSDYRVNFPAFLRQLEEESQVRR